MVRRARMREAGKDFGFGCELIAKGAFLGAIAAGIAVLGYVAIESLALTAPALILTPVLGAVIALGSLALLFVTTGVVVAAESTPTLLSGGRYWPKSRSRLAHFLLKVWGLAEK